MRNRIVALALALGLLTLSGVASAAASAAPAAQNPAGTAQVTVVHAFRGLVADVYLNGERQLEGFAPERLAGPLALPAGRHDVAVYEAGQAPPAAPVLAATLQVEAGTNLSVVVHPGQDGQPRASVFPNDLGPLPAGQGRLAVRHTAGAAPLDVLVDGAPLAQGVASGEEAVRPVSAGGHQTVASVSGQPLLPPADVVVEDGATTVLYLTGAQDSLGWLTQTLQGQATAPGGIPTGTSGLAAPATGLEAAWTPGGGLVLVLTGVVLLRRRARTTRT